MKILQCQTWQDQEFCIDIIAELNMARAKFPTSNLSLAALMEEVGELAQAMLKVRAGTWPAIRIREEAIQVAAMAFRVALEGDASFASVGYIEPDPDPAQPAAVAQVVAEPAPPKYGYCPMCFVPGIARDHQFDGNDRCERGHVYKSTAAIASKPSTLSRDLEALIAPAICPICNGTSADAFAACKITEGVKCPMGRLEFSARGVD